MVHKHKCLKRVGCARIPGVNCPHLVANMTSSCPGGNIAAAWAAMKSLGEEGYMARAKTLMDITDKLKEGIAGIEVHP